MKAEIRLLRHGDSTHMMTPGTVAGRAPYSVLTEAGIRQAEDRGIAWKAESYLPALAYTSPLIRASSTLQIAQGAAGLPMEAIREPAIAEQCLGYDEGRPRDEVYTPYTKLMIARQGALYRHQSLNKEGVKGQSMMDVAKSMYGFLGRAFRDAVEFEDDFPEVPIVAMSHHIAIKSLVGYLELGGSGAAVDPHQLHDLTLNRPPIVPCSESLFTVEADPSDTGLEDFKVYVGYVGRVD